MHNTIAAMSYLMVSSLHWMWDPSTRVGAGSVLITSSHQTLSPDLACSWQAIPRAEWANEWMGHPETKFYQGHVSSRLFPVTFASWPPPSAPPLPTSFFYPKAERLIFPPRGLIWKKWRDMGKLLSSGSEISILPRNVAIVQVHCTDELLWFKREGDLVKTDEKEDDRRNLQNFHVIPLGWLILLLGLLLINSGVNTFWWTLWLWSWWNP